MTTTSTRESGHADPQSLRRPLPTGSRRAICKNHRPVDRRLANRNLRTALIAGMIALIVFAASFGVALVY